MRAFIYFLLAISMLFMACEKEEIGTNEVRPAESFNVIFPDTVVSGEQVEFTFNVYVSGCSSYSHFTKKISGDSILIDVYEKKPPTSAEVICPTAFFLQEIEEEITLVSLRGEKSLVFNDTLFVKKVFINP